MHKNKSTRPAVTTRTAQPGYSQEKDGTPVFHCPFCIPTHPLKVGHISACGTVLELQAKQAVVHTKYFPGKVCIKCGKSGGKMVKYQSGYIHLNDCTPGVATLTERPKFSRFARIVYKLPKRAKSIVERLTGQAMEAQEADSDGTRTGKIDYFFMKGKSDA